MTRKPIAIFCLGAFITLTCLFCSAWAFDKTLVLSQDTLTSLGTDKLSLTFNIGAAKVTLVRSEDVGNVVVAQVTYSDERLEPHLTGEVYDTVYLAVFDSGAVVGQPEPTEPVVHEWTITVGSYDVATALVLNFGAVEGTLDLGGMPVTSINFNLGATDLDADFSVPTTRRVETFLVETGASQLGMTNIGNTDFDKFAVTAGAASMNLDFHGALGSGYHTVVGNIGAGTLHMSVPAGAGEFLQMISALSTTKVSGDGWIPQVKRFFLKQYITNDYGTQDTNIDLKIVSAVSDVAVVRE
jgi:hypothetical protein